METLVLIQYSGIRVRNVSLRGAVVSYPDIEKTELISASAGSGKTTMLVKRIVDVVGEHSADEVVAITFTNAAAREVRERVVRAFSGSEREDEIREMVISTIHSFFAGILREQSIVLNISPDFKIVDAVDSRILFSDISRVVILSKLSEELFKDLLLEYDFNKLSSILLKLKEKYGLLRGNLNLGFEDFLRKEREGEYTKLKHIIGEDFLSEVADIVLSISCSDPANKLEEDRSYLIPFIKDLKPLVKALYKEDCSRDLFHKIVGILKNIVPPKNVAAKRSLKGWSDGDSVTLVQKAVQRVADIVKEVDALRLGDDSISQEAARIESLVMTVFKEVHDLFRRRKMELEVLDFDDIEIMTYDLIESRPDIAEYYRNKYSYILVDEFQDTNVMQRDVLFKLGQKLFLVGDAKQSIYKFRNADVSVFIETKNMCLDAEAEQIGTNYRSFGKIIDAVNCSFKILFDDWLSVRNPFDADHHEMTPTRDSEAGLVKFYNIGDLELEGRCALEIIQKGIADGRNPDDFAILFRAKEHIPLFENLLRMHGLPSIVLGETSKSNIIKWLSSIFKAILNPYDDFSLLETLKLPLFYLDDECIYRLKKDHIWDGIRTYDLKENKDAFSVENLNSINLVRNFINDMNLCKNSGSFPEFVAEVLKLSKFIPSIASLYPGQELSLEEMIFEIAGRVEDYGGGIERMLEVLSFTNPGKKDLKSSGMIKLMTVHAAKGLEFPVVILPCLHHEKTIADLMVVSSLADISVKLTGDDSGRRFNTSLYSLIRDYEMDAQLAESKRLLYVAMTRAKDELYFLGNFRKASNKDVKKSLKWLDWLSYIFQEDIEDWNFSDSENLSFKPFRNVVRVNLDDAILRSDRVGQQIGRRFSVSMIRDFVTCPFLMLRKVASGEDVTLEKSDNRLVGTILHSILEHRGDEDFISSVYDKLYPSVREALQATVDGFVASDIGDRIFSAEDFLVEHSFLALVAGNVVTGRIDRINIYEDSVWVIDYKTGIEEKMGLEGFKAQMACYLYFASHAFPDKRIYGSIVDVVSCSEHRYELEDFGGWIEKVLIDVNQFLESRNSNGYQKLSCGDCSFSKDCSYSHISPS